jgi:hypothetical protein
MKNKIYTLCFDVDITYDENPWNDRKVIALTIQRELESSFSRKVKVSVAEMQRNE